MVELDEGFFETDASGRVCSKLKRGKGSHRLENVNVMAESVPLEDLETGKKSKSCRYFKMQVLDNHSGDSITYVVQELIDEKSIVFTEKSSSYIDICKYVEGHLMEKSNALVTKETLRWVHIAISNEKRTFWVYFIR